VPWKTTREEKKVTVDEDDIVACRLEMDGYSFERMEQGEAHVSWKWKRRWSKSSLAKRGRGGHQPGLAPITR